MEKNFFKKWMLFPLGVFVLMACFACGGSGDDDSDDGDDSGSSGLGSVKITNLTAKKSTITGVTIYVKLSTSGVTSSQVRMLGAQGGSTSDGNGSLWASVGSGETSGTAEILTASSKKTYYIKGFLKTSSGTVYSSVKKITTP